MAEVAGTTSHTREELEADAWASTLASIQVVVENAGRACLISLLVSDDSAGVDPTGEPRLK